MTGRLFQWVGLDAIEAAQARIAPVVAQTPLSQSKALSRPGAPVHLKLETRQHTGSFKLRGAANFVASLAASGPRGFIAASTGNHGRALAHAAKAQNARVVVCMSRLTPANKIAAVKASGAEIRIVGASQDEAQLEVDRLALADGLIEAPPFDDAAVIAGQGTLGLEIVEELPNVALVLVPLSGGGLASGVAAAIKGRRPDARIVGVSMARGAAMHASLHAGKPVHIEELETLADSLGGGVGLANRYTFAMCRALLDDVILLSEEEIAEGVRHAFLREGEIVEGAGAVGIAAILAGKIHVDGPTAIVISGGNIDEALHRRIVAASSQKGAARWRRC